MGGQNEPMWSRSAPVDGFRLAYDRFGTKGDAGHFTPLECPDHFAELILIRAHPSDAG
jgi:hypothetical protein